jgi:hypothetical protein
MFYPSRIQGSNRKPEPGSGSATLLTGSGYNVGIGFFHFTSFDFSYRSYLYQMAAAGCVIEILPARKTAVKFISSSDKFYFKFFSDPELSGSGMILSGSGSC